MSIMQPPCSVGLLGLLLAAAAATAATAREKTIEDPGLDSLRSPRGRGRVP
jgi:hypothetical protein